jgi:hypothetical protein
MRPVVVSIAGVLDTATLSRPFGTVNVCQRALPLFSATATRLPRAWLLSLFAPEMPM